MNKINLNLLLSLLLISFTYGCQKEELTPKGDISQQPLIENKLLWEVSGNGLEQPFNLYGTIHLIEKEKLTFLPALGTLLETSTGLILETDITDQQIIDATGKRVFLPNTVNPKTYYTDDEWNLMSKVCERIGFSIQYIEQLKPIAVTSYIFPSLLGDKKNNLTSCEEELVQLAKQYKVNISGFESEDYVYTYFDSLSLSKQYKDLYQLLDQYDQQPETILSEYEQLITTYMDQDINKMLESVKEDPKVHEHLIIKRNYHWLNKINSSFAGKLVAVGAGHLAGEQGLLQLLIRNGYTVKAIS